MSCKNRGAGKYQPLALSICATGYFPWKYYKETGITCSSTPIAVFGPTWAAPVLTMDSAMVACAQKSVRRASIATTILFSDKTCLLYSNCESETVFSAARSTICKQFRDTCYDCPTGRFFECHYSDK